MQTILNFRAFPYEATLFSKRFSQSPGFCNTHICHPSRLETRYSVQAFVRKRLQSSAAWISTWLSQASVTQCCNNKFDCAAASSRTKRPKHIMSQCHVTVNALISVTLCV